MAVKSFRENVCGLSVEGSGFGVWGSGFGGAFQDLGL